MYVMYLQENVVVNMLSYMYMHMSARRMKGGGSHCKDCHKLLIFLCTEGTNVILFKIYIGIQCQQSKSKIF